MIAAMGWNTSLIAIKDCSLDDLAGRLTLGALTSCDQGGDDAVAIQVGADVVVAGNPAQTDAVRTALAPTGPRLVCVMLGSTGDAYELRVQDGSDVARLRAEVEGETVADEGEPLPDEHRADAEEFPEDRFLALFAIAGGPMIGDWYFDPSGRIVTPAPSPGAAPESAVGGKPRGLKRLFGRG